MLLYGPAKYLFTPMALTVVIAMLASYLLSRTLVPTMARMLMPGGHGDRSGANRARHRGRFGRAIYRFNCPGASLRPVSGGTAASFEVVLSTGSLP